MTKASPRGILQGINLLLELIPITEDDMAGFDCPCGTRALKHDGNLVMDMDGREVLLCKSSCAERRKMENMGGVVKKSTPATRPFTHHKAASNKTTGKTARKGGKKASEQRKSAKSAHDRATRASMRGSTGGGKQGLTSNPKKAAKQARKAAQRRK